MLDVTSTKAVLCEYGFDWLDRLVTVKRAEAVDVGSLPGSPLNSTWSLSVNLSVTQMSTKGNTRPNFGTCVQITFRNHCNVRQQTPIRIALDIPILKTGIHAKFFVPQRKLQKHEEHNRITRSTRRSKRG